MDFNDKVARCRLIASIIVADEVVEDVELEFLENAMDEFELSEEERAQVMVLFDEQEALAALAGLSRVEKLEFLDVLAKVAWVDNDLDDDEIDHIQGIGVAMGFDTEIVLTALQRAAPAEQ